MSHEPKKKHYCDICTKKFGITRASKQCKRCENIVCKDCTVSKKKMIYGLDKKSLEPHKRCVNCANDQHSIEKFIFENNLKWACETQIADQWMISLEINPNSNLQADYDQALKQVEHLQTPSYGNLIDMINCTNEIKDSFKNNYSFYEVLCLIPNNYAEQQIKVQVKDICSAFLSRHYKDIGISQQIMNLAVFLLCFSSPCQAFAILSAIYTKIIPSYMYDFNKTLGFAMRQSQISNFTTYLRTKLQVGQDKLSKMQKFFDFQWIWSMNDLFVKVLQFETSFEMINMIIRSNDKYSSLVKVLLAIPKIHLNNIVLLGPENSDLFKYILDFTQKDALKQCLNFDLQTEMPYLKTNNTQTLMDSLKKVEHSNKDLEQKNRLLTEENDKAQFQIVLLGGEIERLTAFGIQQNKQDKQNDNKQGFNDPRISLPPQIITNSLGFNNNNSENEHNKKQIKQLQEDYNEMQKKYYDLKGDHLKLQKKCDDLTDRSKSDSMVSTTTTSNNYNNTASNSSDNCRYQLELLQRNYQDMENKFMKACARILIIGSECERLSEINKDLLISNPQQLAIGDQDSLEIGAEVGKLKVQLNKKERELEKLKIAYRENEVSHNKQLEEVKQEYKETTNRELKRISDKFQAESRYLESEWEKQKQLTAEWEEKAVIALAENERLRKQDKLGKEKEKERITNEQRSEFIKQKTFKMEQKTIIEHQQQPSSELHEQLNDARRIISSLKEKENQQSDKIKNILQKHLLLVIENKRLAKILDEFRTEIKQWKENSQDLEEEAQNLRETIHKRDTIIMQLQEEMDNFNHSTKIQLTGNDSESNKQILKLQQEKAQLIKENGDLKLQIEQIKVEENQAKAEIQKLKNKERDLKEKHQQELDEVRREYEEVVIKELTQQAQQQINELKRQLAEKNKYNEENIRYLQEQLQNTQSTIEVLELKNKDFKQQVDNSKHKYRELEKQIEHLQDNQTILKNENDRKQKRIKDLEYQIETLNEQLQMIRSDLDRRDHKVKELEKKINSLESQHREELNEKKNRINQLEEQLNHLRSEMAKFREEKNDAIREKEEEKEKNDQLRQELERQQEKYSRMVKEKNDILYEQEKEHAEKIKQLQREKNEQLEQQRDKQMSEKELNNKLLDYQQQVEELENKLVLAHSELQRKDLECKELKRVQQEQQEKLNKLEKELMEIRRAQVEQKEEKTVIQQTITTQQIVLQQKENVTQKAFARIILIASENERLNTKLYNQEQQLIDIQNQKQNYEYKLTHTQEELERQELQVKRLQRQVNSLEEENQFKIQAQVQENQRKIQDLERVVIEKETLIEKHTYEVIEVKQQLEDNIKKTHGQNQDLDELLERSKRHDQIVADLQSNIQNQNQQIRDLEEEIAKLQTEVARLKKKITSQEIEVADGRTEVEIKINQLKESTNIIDALKTSLRHKNISLVEAENKCFQLEADIKKLRN